MKKEKWTFQDISHYIAKSSDIRSTVTFRPSAPMCKSDYPASCYFIQYKSAWLTKQPAKRVLNWMFMYMYIYRVIEVIPIVFYAQYLQTYIHISFLFYKRDSLLSSTTGKLYIRGILKFSWSWIKWRQMDMML